MFRFFRLFRSSKHLHYSIILFLLLLLSIGPVSSQEVTPEPQPSPTLLPTSTLPPTLTLTPTNTSFPPTLPLAPTNTPLPPTLTPAPTDIEAPTITNTSVPTNSELSSTTTSTPSPTSTPLTSTDITLTTSPILETTLTPSATLSVAVTTDPAPTMIPFVPSPTPFPGGELLPLQPDTSVFSSSLPINTITLGPQSDESDLINALVTANPTTCTNHTVINLPSAQVYTLTQAYSNFVELGANLGPVGLPVIRCEVTINGSDTQIIRDASLDTTIPPVYFRILGVSSTGILRLNGIDIRHGYATTIGGGAILGHFGG